MSKRDAILSAFASRANEVVFGRLRGLGLSKVESGLKPYSEDAWRLRVTLDDGREIQRDFDFSELRANDVRHGPFETFAERCGAYMARHIEDRLDELRLGPKPERTVEDCIKDGVIPLGGGVSVELGAGLDRALGDLKYEIAEDMLGKGAL